MSASKRYPALDSFRLIAAVLVTAIHTSPLAGYTPLGDFLLTRVLARTAVPFFLMVSGYFLAKDGWRSAGKTVKKLLALYAGAAALYLPLNWYQGGLAPLAFLKRLALEGTFYHLWYFPAAVLGILIARQLSRLGKFWPLALAGALYLVGLGGDSYYGLVSRVPALKAVYGGIFAVFDYTRNGIFFAPLFLLLGAEGRRWSGRVSAAGLLLSLGAMTGEALWLRQMGVQRHDSMYLLLPVCMVFLFSLLLERNKGRAPMAREMSLFLYLLHPWCIVLVRGGAKAWGLERVFIENSLGHFAAVLVLSLAASWALYRLRPRPRPVTDRAWRELDLQALDHNARVLRDQLAPGCELMAVVKGNAYGHGAVPVARRLWKKGTRAFAVACLSEGIALRRAGIGGTILILGYTPPEEVHRLEYWRLTQTVADLDHGMALASTGRPVRVHLALDTGMHRLGIPAEDRQAIAALYGQKNLRIGGVYSHLCVCDSLERADMDFTESQLARFYSAVDWMCWEGLDPGAVHIQSSYGIWNLPAQPCRFARVGIALYGVRSDSQSVRRELDLRPVLALRARVASVRTVACGQDAGYGCAFRAKRDSRLAVVTIGYGDGLPRQLSQSGGQVLIRGRRAPMVGRMCMDQLLVDVTELPQACPGDVATLIGRDGGEELRAEELAQCCATITNELLSQLGSRLETRQTDF